MRCRKFQFAFQLPPAFAAIKRPYFSKCVAARLWVAAEVYHFLTGLWAAGLEAWIFGSIAFCVTSVLRATSAKYRVEHLTKHRLIGRSELARFEDSLAHQVQGQGSIDGMQLWVSGVGLGSSTPCVPA